MTRKTKLIFTIIGAVLAVAIITGGVIAISKAAKKNKQAKCSHEYGEMTVISNASCEVNGIQVQTCKLCGYERSEEILATGHTEMLILPQVATCTKTGLSDGIECLVCGKAIVERQVIPAMGHNIIVDQAQNPTCLSSGLTVGSHCRRCGEIILAQETVPATGHEIVIREGYPATCENTGLTDGSYCVRCNNVYTAQEEIAPTSHNYVEGYCSYCSQPNFDVAVELTVEKGDTVAGNWYRIYKDYEGYYPNAIYVSTGADFGFGASSSYEGLISAPKASSGNNLITGNYICIDHEDYIDVYIGVGEYHLGIGPYNASTYDSDGNGTYDFTIDQNTTISELFGSSKIFRLTFEN